MTFNKKLFTLLAAFCSLFAASAASDLTDLRGLALNNAKIPVYGSRQQLQMMTFVDNAVRDGKVIIGKNTVLDLIKSGSNVDDIKDAWQLKYYPLQAKMSDVFKFWLKRLSYSEGVVITEKAHIDQDQDRAFGESPVYFRSPLIDLDGIGFDVSFKRRTIQVNSDVKVVLRTASCDPRKLKEKDAEKLEHSFVMAYSDALLIDIERNQLMLVGSVRVIDRKSVLTCDRLTIFLDDQDDKKGKASGEKRHSGINVEGEKGVARILADGNVVITNGTGLAAQRAFADHLNYDVRLGIFHFTGDKVNPRFVQKQEVVSGKNIILYREEQQARVIGECSIVSRAANGAVRHITSDRGDIDFKINRGAFAGNVVMRDTGVIVSGPRANLELANRPGKDKKRSEPSDRMLPDGMGSSSGFGGGRDLRAVEFPDGIRVVDPASQKAGKPMDLAAKTGRYDALGKFIDFKENVVLNDSQMTLNTSEMQIKLDEKSSLDPVSGKTSVERIVCQKGVKIIGKGKNAGTLTSQIGVFFYRRDLLVFVNDVKVTNKETTLTCDRLDLYLVSSSGGKNAPAQTGIAGIGGSNKVLSKAVATGERVLMVDPQNRLETKKLTVNFEEIKAGEKPTPGMLQSGNSRVTWIACDDGMRLESKSDSKSTGKSSGDKRVLSKGKRIAVAKRSETDLKKNVARFFSNVSVYDEKSRLDCDRMTVYAAPFVAPAAVSKADDPDADPFALGRTEDSVPSNIMLGKDMELKRVFCEDNVVLSTTENGRRIQAGGDTGEYLSSTRKMVLKANPPQRTWMQAEGRRQWCDRIVCDVDEERIYSSGRTYTEPYSGK